MENLLHPAPCGETVSPIEVSIKKLDEILGVVENMSVNIREKLTPVLIPDCHQKLKEAEKDPQIKQAQPPLADALDELRLTRVIRIFDILTNIQDRIGV